jgi:hypothetical protein
MAIEMTTITTKPCVVCLRTSEITAPANGVDLWRAGAHIQDALPDLTADEREMLISGTHPDCFDQLFDEDED